MKAIRFAVGTAACIVAMLAFCPLLLANEYMLYEVNGSVESGVDECGYNSRAVYYNGAVYKFTSFQDGDWYKIGTRKLIYDATEGDGFGNFKEHYNCKRIFPDCNNYRGNNVAPLVYNGKIYVFYDIRGYGKNRIYYKTSLNPLDKFTPEKGFGDEAVGQRNSPEMPFTAYVFENRLHVVYMDSYNTGNGTGWCLRARSCGTDGAWTDSPLAYSYDNTQLKPNWMDSKVVQDDEGVMVPVIAIHFYDDASSDAFWVCKIVEGDFYRVHSEYGIETPTGGIWLLEAGTNGMPAGNSISVFVSHESDTIWTEMTRYQFEIGKGYSKLKSQGKELMTFNNHTRYKSACPVLYYSASAGTQSGDPKNLQQFFSIIITHYTDILNPDLRALTFKNELFKYNGKTAKLNSVEHKDGDKLWTLVGVVEGVPPFVDKKAGWKSSLQYGQSDDKSVSTSQSFSGSWYVGATGGKKNVISMGLTYTEGWKEVQNYTKSHEAKISYNFTNDGENDEGKWGYLIYSMPTFTWDSYDRYAPDSNFITKDIIFGYVSGLSLNIRTFELQNPPEGMDVRPKSSEPSQWMENVYYSQDSKIGDINMLTCSSKGVAVKSDFSKTEVNTTEKSNSHSIKLDIKMGNKNTFMVSSGGSHNWEVSSKTSTKVSSYISASLSYSGKESGRMIEVVPYWLKYPDYGVPSWCPKANRGDSPWCITWKVRSYEPQAPQQENSPNSLGFNNSPAIVAAGTRTKGGKKEDSYSAYAVIYGIDKRGKCTSPIYFQHPEGEFLFLDTFSMDTEADSALLWLNLADGSLLIDEIEDVKISSSKTIDGLTIDADHEYLASDLFVWKDGAFRDAIAVCEIATGNISVHSIDSDCKVIESFEVLKDKGPQWYYLGNGDFNADGIADILVQNFETYEINMILLKTPDETGIVESISKIFDTIIVDGKTYTPADFEFIGIGDFNCDSKDDVLIELPGQKLAPILMDGSTVLKAGLLEKVPKSLAGGIVADIADYNSDGYADIIFRQAQMQKDGTSTILLKLACLTSKGTDKKPNYTAKIKKLIKLGINPGDNQIIDND